MCMYLHMCNIGIAPLIINLQYDSDIDTNLQDDLIIIENDL